MVRMVVSAIGMRLLLEVLIRLLLAFRIPASVGARLYESFALLLVRWSRAISAAAFPADRTMCSLIG